MIDEKNSRQESVNADSSDSEVIIDLTDEVIIQTEDDNGHIGTAEDMADEAPKTAEKEKASKVEENEDREMTAEFDPKAPDDDHVIIIDNARDETDENLSVMAGGETAEAQNNGDRFDLEGKIELEYELDDKEDEFIDLDDERAKDNQEFVNLVLGGSEESDQSDDDEEKQMQYLGFEPEDQDDIVPPDNDRDDSLEDDEKTVAPAEDAPQTVKSEEDLLDLDSGADQEADDEIIPLDGFNGLEADNEEDIIEITEFDQHFPTSGEALLKQTGMLDPAGDEEEDYLKLIDVEEGNLSKDEKFDFNLDAGAFAKQIDRLDAFFLSENSADAPKMASLPVSQAEGDESGHNNSQIGLDMREPLTVPPGQIDAAIERVINEKFSGKIEDIIYEVIEKAVAKEIDRLKGILIGNDRIDDIQP